MDDDSCFVKYIEIVPLDGFRNSPDSPDVKCDALPIKVGSRLLFHFSCIITCDCHFIYTKEKC